MIDPFSRLALARSGGAIHPVAPLGSRVPRISVVIPCYNYGHFLLDCVASALDHAGLQIEVIIVDDASSDGSGEVAAAIAAGDPRVSLIQHETNKRHLATYNDGFAAATGEYLVQLSADDLLPRDSLTRAVALLESHPTVGFVYGRTVRFRETPPMPKTEVKAWLTWPGEQWVAARCRSGFNVIATTEVVWRKSLMDEVGSYRLDLPHSGDLELWLRMASAADVGFVAGPDQAFYRLHGANMHNEMFGSGTMTGQFVDMTERWKAFEAFLSGMPHANKLRSEMLALSRVRFADEALNRCSYAYARGFRGFPFELFESFAAELNPLAGASTAGRALDRRKRMGFAPLPVHPMWVAQVAWDRARAPVLTWRRGQVGL